MLHVELPGAITTGTGTALHLAAALGHVDVTTLLIHGASYMQQAEDDAAAAKGQVRNPQPVRGSACDWSTRCCAPRTPCFSLRG